MRKKFKTGLLFLLTCSIIVALLGLVGAILSFNPAISYEHFKSVFVSIIEHTGMTFEQYLEGLEIEEAFFMSVVSIVFLVLNIFAIILGTLGIIFSLLSLKDVNVSKEEFRKKNTVHVFAMISCFLVLSGAGLSTILSFYDGLEYIVIGLAIFLIMAFVKILKGNNANKLLKDDNEKEATITPTYSYENNYSKPVEEKMVVEEPQVKAKPVDNKALEDTYQLLAKLEKSYKNGEISEDDYKRMKSTIIDTYLNK